MVPQLERVAAAFAPSTRSIMRLGSMLETFSATTSMARKPARRSQ